MLTHFIHQKLKNARYKKLDDGTYYGSISGVKGVWANADTLEECREELREALEDWLLIKLRSGDKVKGLQVRETKRSADYA